MWKAKIVRALVALLTDDQLEQWTFKIRFNEVAQAWMVRLRRVSERNLVFTDEHHWTVKELEAAKDPVKFIECGLRRLIWRFGSNVPPTK